MNRNDTFDKAKRELLKPEQQAELQKILARGIAYRTPAMVIGGLLEAAYERMAKENKGAQHGD